MSRLTRRGLLGGAIALPALAPCRPAHAARFTLRYANDMVETHPLNLRVQEALDRIRTETAGAVDIQRFVDNRLGGDTDMLEMLHRGQIDFLSMPAQVLGRQVPLASLTSVGFAFGSYEQVWPALDGPLGAHVRAGIEDAGFMVFDRIWDNGFRQVTTGNKTINSMTDLKDLRIRVPNGPMALSMFLALGAAPASINLSDLYPALQAHVFDAQENPLAVIDSRKLYEVQHMCAMTNHMWDGFWFLGNSASFERLPEDIRGIIRRNINAAALLERADLRRKDAELVGRLTQTGMTFTTPDTAPFRSKLHSAGFYADWKRRYGLQAWSLLEQATGVSA